MDKFEAMQKADDLEQAMPQGISDRITAFLMVAEALKYRCIESGLEVSDDTVLQASIELAKGWGQFDADAT